MKVKKIVRKRSNEQSFSMIIFVTCPITTKNEATWMAVMAAVVVAKYHSQPISTCKKIWMWSSMLLSRIGSRVTCGDFYTKSEKMLKAHAHATEWLQRLRRCKTLWIQLAKFWIRIKTFGIAVALFCINRSDYVCHQANPELYI